MEIFFTVVQISKNRYILDSISKDYFALKYKFPFEQIYKASNINSIYLNKSQLNEI